MRIGAAIIDAINDDGYLIEVAGGDCAQPAARDCWHDRRGRARPRHVQALDPAGVGARSVANASSCNSQLDAGPGPRDSRSIAAELSRIGGRSAIRARCGAQLRVR